MLEIKNILSNVTENGYNNVEAHNELKSIMSQKERVQVCFIKDRFGCEALWVESKTRKGFPYQLNQDSFDWFIRYIMTGETEDVNVNPSDIAKSEFADSNSLREAMMKLFIQNEIGRIQFTPEFRDRPGKLSATVMFKYGTILFYLDRTEELTNYLREKGLIR